MRTLHTPGPWKPDFAAYPYEIDGKVRGKTVVVAEIYDEGSECGNGKADAHLIAAAPDMLEALEAEVCSVQCPKTCCGKMRAAIAKAKGAAA